MPKTVASAGAWNATMAMPPAGIRTDRIHNSGGGWSAPAVAGPGLFTLAGIGCEHRERSGPTRLWSGREPCNLSGQRGCPCCPRLALVQRLLCRCCYAAAAMPMLLCRGEGPQRAEPAVTGLELRSAAARCPHPNFQGCLRPPACARPALTRVWCAPFSGAPVAERLAAAPGDGATGGQCCWPQMGRQLRPCVTNRPGGSRPMGAAP